MRATLAFELDPDRSCYDGTRLWTEPDPDEAFGFELAGENCFVLVTTNREGAEELIRVISEALATCEQVKVARLGRGGEG